MIRGTMIFETLHESNQRGELFGSICHWHLRRDGQITIREIIVEQAEQGNGIGLGFLNRLKRVKGATSIFAKTPVDLDSNGWYLKNGFTLEGQETTKNGRTLNLWRLKL